MYTTALPGTDADAFALVQKNDLEHPGGQWPLYKLGKYYEICRGRSRHLRKAFGRYKEGAELGNTMVQRELGNCLFWEVGARCYSLV